MRLPYPVVVGGHICLDVIPTLYERQAGMQAILVPGKLVEIGPAVLATGGAVSNTGLALHRLGMPTSLMGKVGDDWFGRAILDVLRERAPSLAEGMIVAPGEATSYTIVVSPPGIDRIFLHCTGANDTFGAEDIREESLRQAGLFHFGYPPLMKRMYSDDGSELARLLDMVRATGVTTSLDMAKPDPDAAAGRVDWRTVLSRVLPSVDLFLPSFEEMLFMLRRELYDRWQGEQGSADLLPYANGELLGELADELLGMGAAVVVLKLGEFGLYMKTSNAERIAACGRCRPADPAAWANRELYVPCFQVRVAGTTGAGDCTIAGFLAGWLQQLPPEAALAGAVGVGACNVEQPDAASGIRPWEEVQARMRAGWEQHSPKLRLDEFRSVGSGRPEGADGPERWKVWIGPGDRYTTGGLG